MRGMRNATAAGSPNSLMPPHRSGYSLAVETVIVVLLAILSSTGNITVLIATLRSPSLKSRVSSLLIASLAVDDLLMVGQMAFRLVLLHDRDSAARVCSEFSAILVVLVFINVLHLTALSCDRYIAVIHPLRYHAIVTARTMEVVLPVIWLAPMMAPVLPQILFGSSAGDQPGNIGCPTRWRRSPVSHQAFVFLLAGIFVGFPCVIMATTYSIIAWVSYNQSAVSEPHPQGLPEQQERIKKEGKEMKWVKTLGKCRLFALFQCGS